MARDEQVDPDMKFSDTFTGMPMWFRATAIVGASTVAAGYLIWFITIGLAADVKTMRESLMTHAMQTAYLVEKVTESRAASDAKVDVLIRIAQTQCVNAATDVVQRRNCIDAGGR